MGGVDQLASLSANVELGRILTLFGLVQASYAHAPCDLYPPPYTPLPKPWI